MGVSQGRLAETYPKLYHMAERGTWESIREHGLLSTSALLDLFQVNGDRRAAIERQHRPQSMDIEHPVFGTATIRDQKPMRERSLLSCLDGVTPEEWYQILNSRVFFWPTEKRLQNLLGGREYRGRVHTVLVLSTERLLERYGNQVELSPINSGSTLYVPQRRGRYTFSSLQDYPFEERHRKAGKQNAVAELTVDYSVPEVEDLVLEVSHMRGAEVIERIL